MKNPVYFHSLYTAPPRAPVPKVEECHEYSDSQDTDDTCVIATESAINITCSAYEFFPNINLYFLHNLANVVAVESRERNNTDWTRNRSVTITAVPSTNPYVCVASDIPGFGEQDEEISVIIYLPSTLTTSTTGRALNMSTEGSPQGANIAGEGKSETAT